MASNAIPSSPRDAAHPQILDSVFEAAASGARELIENRREVTAEFRFGFAVLRINYLAPPCRHVPIAPTFALAARRPVQMLRNERVFGHTSESCWSRLARRFLAIRLLILGAAAACEGSCSEHK